MFTISRDSVHSIIDALTEPEIRTAAEFLHELHGDDADLVLAGAASDVPESWYGYDVPCTD